MLHLESLLTLYYMPPHTVYYYYIPKVVECASPSVLPCGNLFHAQCIEKPECTREPEARDESVLSKRTLVQQASVSR